MDLTKRLLASPMARKKGGRLSNGGQTSTIKPDEAILLTSTRPFTKYFGIALNIITEREGVDVPRLVSQTCEFIYDKGLDTEGLFRINGNARLVEKLKSSIEESNELVFDDQIDIMTAASFLKLFLRELPDSLIPQSIAGTLLEVQQAHRTDADVCYAELRGLLKQLPRCNYETLKYIVSLLVLVSKLEAKNKMNPMALGIVFGPNFFRASMKEQGITNFVVCNFITGYDAIFFEDGELPSTSPYFSLRTKRLRPAPPRPPAPKQDNGSPQKRISNGGHHYGNGHLPVPLDLTLCITPRSDEEDEFLEPNNSPTSNRLSDSDRSEVASTIFSPRGLPVTNKILDKEISKVISEQLFGDSSPLESSDEQTTDPDGSDVVDNGDLTFHHCVPVPLPRRRRREQQMTLSDNRKKIHESEATEMAETQNIQARAVNNGNAWPELKPKSRAQELFKSRANTTKSTSQLPDDDLVVPLKWNLISEGSLHEKVLVEDLTSVGQLHSPLSTFKRSAGPKNRRAPSCYSQNVSDSRKPEIFPAVERSSERSDRNRDSLLEVDRKVKRPKIAFLELHHADSNREANASKISPPVSKVSSIPNLDLTILHEHGDGNEPITVDKGSSISFQKHSGSHDPGLLLFVNTKFSPPMNQNTDIPPSPPDRQEYTKNRRADDDDDMVRIKQLTKKIQSCKKKLRAFEERFENQNGFKPSQTVKAADPEIKKCILELARARKDLKKLKEEAEKIDTHSGLPSGDDSQSFSELRLASMGDTLLSLQRRLAKNRKEDGRPENLSLLSHDEIQDEKIEVQKALLEFEGIYGRPSLKSEKELVKPLYDRYRRIKQYLAKASPSDKSKSLQSVPEDSTIDFSPDATTRSSHRQPIRIPIAALETSTEEDPEDFLVTRLLQTSMPEKNHAHPTLSRRQQDHADLKLAYDKSNADTLHNLSLSQLLSQQEEAQIEKRKLARLLRQFEDDFLQQHGRKVQKEDRGPMQSEYKEYKQVKAQLRLLDCLVNKHRLRRNSP